jgi:hypothetical protein
MAPEPNSENVSVEPLLPFTADPKYCHNGGMALAYHHDGASRGEVPDRGVRDRHLGPLSWSPESGPFAGEKAWGP